MQSLALNPVFGALGQELSTAMSVVLLLVGIGILVYCSDLLVDGSVWAARRLGVPTFVVGLTIIAYGTSLPEAVVSILAGLQGASDFAIGNIVGSNIANIGLVLGLTALACAIHVEKTGSLFRRELPWLLGVTMAVLAVVFLNVLEGHSGQRVVVGVIFLGLSLAYTAQALKLNPANFGRKVMRKWFARGPKGRELREGELSLPPQPIGPDDFEGEDSLDEESLDGDADSDSVNEEPVGWGKISLTLLAGFIGLVGGAELMVIGGKNIAVQVGISERIIALTIVAIGTSLPELAASIAAARKGHPELAVGNVVGSCLFNLSFVLGVAAIAAPITVDVDAMKWDFLLMMGLTIMMFVLLWSDRQLSRVEGAVLLSIYLAFMGWVSYQAFTTAGTDRTQDARPAVEVSLLYQPVEKSDGDAPPSDPEIVTGLRIL